MPDPDYCIGVPTDGTDWCIQMSGALMWPEGQPELAELVLTDGSLPKGCVCMNDGEHEILIEESPAEHYAALLAEIDSATRSACVAGVANGYAHNCLELEDGVVPAPLLTKANEDGSSPECVGSCNQIGDPPLGEPCDDPNPWECNGEEPPGGGDTGGGGETGGGETGGTTGLGPVHDRSLLR